MTIVDGRHVQIEVDDQQTGVFVPLTGLITRTLDLAAQTLDSRHLDTEQGWRGLSISGSVKTASFSAGGIVKPASQQDRLIRLFVHETAVPWRLWLSDSTRLSGPFQLITLQFTADLERAVRCRLTAVSAGTVLTSQAELSDDLIGQN